MTEAERIELDRNLELFINVFAPDPHTHIFNTSGFFRLHSDNAASGHYFQLADRKSGAVLACIHFTETKPGVHCSPARGTFGGISCVPGMTIERHEIFLRAVEKYLLDYGARELSIVLPPASHDLALVSTSFNLLVRMGYTLSGQEINHDLAVNSIAFSERIDYGNRKRYRKCLREGFRTLQLPPARYKEAYEVIAGNRRRKAHPITMSFEDIMVMVEAFPDSIRFFGTERDQILAAASVCIALSPRILYVFYWGDADGMHEYSPIVPLAAEIYAHCQDSNFQIMDAGISTVGGEPNHGLIQFKRSLGMRESLKFTLTKCDPEYA